MPRMRWSLLAVSAAVLTFAAGCGKSKGGGGTPTPTPGPTPFISAITPAAAESGTDVTIAGSDFGATQGSSTVTFDGADAAIVSWSATQIVATVPLIGAGQRPVVVHAGTSASAPKPFEILLHFALYTVNLTVPTTTGVIVRGVPNGFATAPGSPFLTGGSAVNTLGDSGAAFVHAATARLFVSNSTTLAVFDLDRTTGVPTAVAGSPFATGLTGAMSVIVNAAGNRAYVGDCLGQAIGIFSISSNGVVAPASGSPVAVGGGCVDIVRLTPDESRLYASVEAGAFVGYDVMGDGSLTPLAASPFTTPPAGYGFEMDPQRDVIYAGNFNDVSSPLYSYSLDALTGAPMLLSSSSIATFRDATSFAFTADATKLYTVVPGRSDIYGFALDSEGRMTPLAGTPWNFSPEAFSALETSGDHLFAADQSGHAIQPLLIASNGVLSLDGVGLVVSTSGSIAGIARARR